MISLELLYRSKGHAAKESRGVRIQVAIVMEILLEGSDVITVATVSGTVLEVLVDRLFDSSCRLVWSSRGSTSCIYGYTGDRTAVCILTGQGVGK